MVRNIFVLLAFAGLALYSCSNSGGEKKQKNDPAQTAILQQQDGTISLQVAKADTYQDVNNPSSNTAEWSVVVSKSGRYNVWLSSATKDTTNLQYDNSVKLSIRDDRIEATPAVDKVIQNSVDVSYPYYRADSFMGSLYIQEAGLYNIQVISDKIVSQDQQKNESSLSEDTKLLSVSLTPVTD
jgi:hypothetical protein